MSFQSSIRKIVATSYITIVCTRSITRLSCCARHRTIPICTHRDATNKAEQKGCANTTDAVIQFQAYVLPHCCRTRRASSLLVSIELLSYEHGRECH